MSNKKPKRVMSIKDQHGADHWIYGDDFVLAVIMDVLEKIKRLEEENARLKGEIQ